MSDEYLSDNQSCDRRDGEVFETHSDAEMFAKLDKAHALWKDSWHLLSFADRRAIVQRAADILRRDTDKHARLISTEMGKVFPEAVWEIGISADILSYYADNAERFLAPRDLEVASGKATVLSQPLGVIYCVEPWNFPITSSPAWPRPT
jgi:succinate-semialdehyde dehydrogenase/glutarate-semialdehyde dehydrogenase